jgi:hypothetical protein
LSRAMSGASAATAETAVPTIPIGINARAKELANLISKLLGIFRPKLAFAD